MTEPRSTSPSSASAPDTLLATALNRHVLGTLPPGDAYSWHDIERLPETIAQHLCGVLTRRVERETVLPASRWFDTEAEAVEQAAGAWRDAAAAAAHFPPDVWETAAKAAVRQVVAYLLDPVATLADRAFVDGPESIPIETVQERIAAFAPYPYLHEIAAAYFGRKNVDEIDRDDFERALERIDRRFVRAFGVDEWLGLLDPLFVLAEVAPSRGGHVATPPLRCFFEAKGRSDLAQALSQSDYDRAALRAFLSTHLAPSDASSKATSDPEASAERRDEPPPPPLDTDEDTSGESEPLWKHLARAKEEGTAQHTSSAVEQDEPTLVVPSAERVSKAERPKAERPKAQSKKEPLWKRFAAPGDAAAAQASPDSKEDNNEDSLADLEARILGSRADGRRSLFVKHLTGGSEQDYRELLVHLDAATSWTEASQLIAEHSFRKHRVNIYTDAAALFTDAVEARFRA